MTQTIDFEGTTHEFPDDFTPQDIQKALRSLPPAGQPAQPAVQNAAPAPPQAPQPAINGPNTVQAPEGGDRRITAVPTPDQSQPFDWSQVPGRLENVARGVAKGGTFGQMNKIAAGLGAATGIGGKFGDYSGNLDAQNAQDQAINADQGPNGARAFKFGQNVGVIASPINKLVPAAVGKVLPLADDAGKLAPLAQRYANYAAQGGLLNMLYQAGMGNKDQAQQSAAGTAGAGAVGMAAPEGGNMADSALTAAKNFGKGALMGAAPMAAIEGGGAILDNVLSPLLSRINPDEAALARIAKAAEEDGLEPDQILSKLGKRGDQGMIADVSPGLTKLAEDTAQFPGDARTMAQRELGARAGSRISTTGGAPGRLQEALQQTLASGTAQEAAASLIAQRENEAGTLFKPLFATPTVPESDALEAMADNPTVTRAMKAGIADARNFANAQGEKVPETAFFQDGKPTLQAWHLAKSKLDQTAYGFTSGKVLQLPEDATPTSIKALSDSIRGVLTENPQYEDAVNKWAGPSAALDALQLGAKAARGDVRVTANVMSDMTDSEKEFFRLGLGDQLQYLISKSPDGSNVAKSIFGNQNARRNLSMAFDSRDDFNQFRQAVAREQNFYNTQTQVLRGSPTASREAGMADQAKEIGAAALEGAKEGGVSGGAFSGAKAAAKSMYASVTQPEAMRSQLGQALFTRDPAKQQQVIDRLKALQARGAIFGQVGGQYVPRTSVLASKIPMSFGGP